MRHEPKINLNDLYAYVGEKIYNWNGFKEVSQQSEEYAYFGYYQVEDVKCSKLFCGASNLFNDYIKGIYDGNEFITFIIPGLREIYSANQKLLPSSEITMFFESADKDVPKFKNISEYSSIKMDKNDISLYQLMGDITPYDVLHISFKDFLSVIDSSKMFKFQLNSIKYNINIYYDSSDMYDPETDSIM